MEKQSYDLTNQPGLVDAQRKLINLKQSVIVRNTETEGLPDGVTTTFNGAHASAKTVAGATATIDVDIEGMFEGLIGTFKNFINRFFDLFDDTKKLEKQMELALKTIEVARAAGAKSIDITINAKNGAGLSLYLKKIDAKIGGKVKKDNTITYTIVF